IAPGTPGGAIHDDTQQGHGFGYFELVLDATSKLSAIVGSFVGNFQIPNSPGGIAAFSVDGVSSFDSTKVNETQLEQNYFAVVSYRKAEADWGLQVATYAGYGNLPSPPLPSPVLPFMAPARPVAPATPPPASRSAPPPPFQPTHTLRAGGLPPPNRTTAQTPSAVLPATNGVQTSDLPFEVFN